jgi:hypothetical protein
MRKEFMMGYTHLSRLGGDVDLDDIVGLVDRLRAAISSMHQLAAMPSWQWFNSVVSCSISIRLVATAVVIPGEGG